MLKQEVILILSTKEWVLLVLRVGLFSSSLVDACTLSRGSVSELMYRLDSMKVSRVALVGEEEDSVLDRDLLAALKVRHKVAYSVSLNTLLLRLLAWDFPDGGSVLFRGSSTLFLISKNRTGQTSLHFLPFDAQDMGVALAQNQDLVQSGLPLLLDDSLLVHLEMFSNIWAGPVYCCSQLRAASRINLNGLELEKKYLSLLTVIQQVPEFRLELKIAKVVLLGMLLLILVMGLISYFGNLDRSGTKTSVAVETVSNPVIETISRPDVIPHPLCPLRFHGLTNMNENAVCGIFSACVQDIILCAGDQLGDWIVETINEGSAAVRDNITLHSVEKSSRLSVPVGVSLLQPQMYGSRVEAAATTAIPAIGLKVGDRLDGFLGKQFVDQEQIRELEVLLRSGLEFTPVPK